MQQALSCVLLVLKTHWFRILFTVSVSGIVLSLAIFSMRKVAKHDRIDRIEGLITDVKFLPAQGWGNLDYTVIKFDDGREKVFSEINEALVFQKGKMNVIRYKPTGSILSVEVK